MNFDKVVDRRGTYCTQWDYIEDRFGEGSGDLPPSLFQIWILNLPGRL